MNKKLMSNVLDFTAAVGGGYFLGTAAYAYSINKFIETDNYELTAGALGLFLIGTSMLDHKLFSPLNIAKLAISGAVASYLYLNEHENLDNACAENQRFRDLGATVRPYPNAEPICIKMLNPQPR